MQGTKSGSRKSFNHDVMKSTYLFFELLQVALGPREKLSRIPSAAEWGGMYDEAERQAIVGLQLSGIERLPTEQLPPLDVKLQWIGVAQMDEATYKLHVQRVAELTRRFAQLRAVVRQAHQLSALRVGIISMRT